MTSRQPEPSEGALRAEASNWVVRCDRGLSAAESIEFELWLAANDRHALALRQAKLAWSILDRIPGSTAAPVLAEATRHRSFWRRTRVIGSVAAAAAAVIVLASFYFQRQSISSVPPVVSPSLVAQGPREVTLADGTIVQLNAGSTIEEKFTPSERHVLLTQGEAHFAVTKNPARPFVVEAGALRVRAVGTAFDVNLRASQIEVLVTEGRVQLASGPASAIPAISAAVRETKIPIVEAGHRAVYSEARSSGSRISPHVIVTSVDAAEIARTLAWQQPLVNLGGATLADIVAEFERRSGRHVILADPALAQLRIGGRLRGDDVDDFANVMAATLDLEVERQSDGTLLLRKKTSSSR